MNVNITSGDCLNEILEERFPDEKWIPFREAMERGETLKRIELSGRLFDDAFCLERSRILDTSVAEYRYKLEGFLDVLEDPDVYDRITLWFGEDSFCRANEKTVLVALKERRYSGLVVCNLVNEVTGEIQSLREVRF